MDIIHSGIITLMKSAVTQEKLSLPEGFDIEAAYPRIKAHHVVSLAYTGAVNCGIDQTHPVMQRMFQGYCKAIQVSERQMREVNRIFTAFDEEKIDYLPLKGTVMKKLYPRPELRMMGDADILIRTEQYKKITAVMNKLGFEKGRIGAAHAQWNSQALCAELHSCLMDPAEAESHEYFDDGWAFARPENGTRYRMDSEDMFAFQFAHFVKHYRFSGIGCRHVVDLWVFLKSHPSMDEEKIRTTLEKMRLWTFYGYIRKLIGVWFENEASDDRTEYITRTVFSNGSWGLSKNALLTRGTRTMGESQSAFRSRVLCLLTTLFPGLEDMRHKYAILYKAPFLLPIMWCVRLLSRFFSIPEEIRKQKDRLLTLNKQALLERKQALEYVGLDDEK